MRRRWNGHWSKRRLAFGYAFTLSVAKVRVYPPKPSRRWQVIWYPLGVDGIPPRIMGSARTKVGANRVARRVGQQVYYGADVKPGNTIQVVRRA